ncbi:TPA: FAD-dependent oxidoreductase [Clostridioides difficile]
MNESYWFLNSSPKEYNKLGENIKTDCLIVGGGITGLTTAYLLAKEGKKVVLVEADKIGYGTSGRNTGKVTCQHDIFYSKIEKKYGLDKAKSYYNANNEALNLVEQIIEENNIKCDFKRETSFVFTEKEDTIKNIKDEYRTCKKIGINCEYHETIENIPLDIKGAISFTNQGQFNPKKYIDGLAKAAVNLGLKIYENTPVVDLEKGKICRVKTREDNIIEAENVIISSHSPWYDGLNFYFAKEYAERAYLMVAVLENKLTDGMFISIDDPSITFRQYNDGSENLLIFGGGDHKVGQGGTEKEIFDDLEHYGKEVFKVKDFKGKWSAQDNMSFDNVPYIGYINKREDNIYVATGFSKWGITNGTVAGIIIKDLIINNNSDYKDTFNPSRLGSYFSKDFIKENANVAINYVSGKLKIGSGDMPKNNGEGKIVNIDGKRYGVYKDDNGDFYIVDTTCTHLGCELNFNSEEKTWDCPCHGSRFDYKGNILEGPALKPLKLYGHGDNDVNPKLL